jgi:hypothetical protein
MCNRAITDYSYLKLNALCIAAAWTKAQMSVVPQRLSVGLDMNRVLVAASSLKSVCPGVYHAYDVECHVLELLGGVVNGDLRENDLLGQQARYPGGRK